MRLELTTEQLRPVHSRESRRTTIADAGSAKSTILIEAVAYDIELGVDANKVLLVTFSNVGAKILSRRLSVRNHAATKASVCTIHGFCLRCIRANLLTFGFENMPEVLSDSEQRRFFSSQLHDLGFKDRKICDSVVAAYGWARNSRKSIEEMCARVPLQQRTVRDILTAYSQMKRDKNKLDFEDILVLMAEKLKASADFRENLSVAYPNVYVDEAQDTSRLQWDIILSIASRLFVVGDSKQSIYSWRGGIGDFESLMPDAARFTLHRNFRSTPQIVALADAIYQTGIYSEKALGPKPVLLGYDNPAAEAVAVAKLATQYKSLSIAVLARTWELLKPVEIALTLSGFKVEKPGNEIQIDNSLLSNMISLFLFGNGERDDNVWQNCLLAVGKKHVTKEHFPNASDSLLPPLDLVNLTGRQYKLLSRLMDLGLATRSFPEALQEFYEDFFSLEFDKDGELAIAVDIVANLAGSQLELRRFLDKPSQCGRTVVVSTVHGQKGSEYDLVFVIGLSEGSFPLGSADDPVEERNLFYVGITRAERLLFMTFPFSDAQGRQRQRSSFLDEFNSDLLMWEPPPAECLGSTMVDCPKIDDQVNFGVNCNQYLGLPFEVFL